MDVLNYKIFKNAPFCKSPKQQNCCSLYVQLSSNSDEFISKTQNVDSMLRDSLKVSVSHLLAQNTKQKKQNQTQSKLKICVLELSHFKASKFR